MAKQKTRRANCPGCKSHTVQERTSGCYLAAEIEGPVDDTPVWLCRNCNHVMPRRVRPTKMDLIIASLEA